MAQYLFMLAGTLAVFQLHCSDSALSSWLYTHPHPSSPLAVAMETTGCSNLLLWR